MVDFKGVFDVNWSISAMLNDSVEVDLTKPDPLSHSALLSDLEIRSIIGHKIPKTHWYDNSSDCFHLMDDDTFEKINTPFLRSILEKPIMMDDPIGFLKTYGDKLIQPASIDVMVKDIEEMGDVYPLTYFDDISMDYKVDFEKYGLDAKNFITFLPKSQTEVSIQNPFTLEHYGPVRDNIHCLTELRSTLRRVGLDISTISMGTCRLGYNEVYIPVRNSNNYAVAVEKGSKVAQILWRENMRNTNCSISEGYGEFRDDRISHGYEVRSKEYLEEIINQGHMKFKRNGEYVKPDIDNVSFTGSHVLFHAGDCATYNSGNDIIICKDKTTYGVETREVQQNSHSIVPGEYIDILTEESMELSEKVGIHVHYLSNQEDSNERMFTMQGSRGGWIDPGYNGVFSVQRKVHRISETINKGDVVAIGKIYFFPDGVGVEYGDKRGSNYNNASKTLFVQNKDA